jgi:AcrR family transcriptional regulator
MPRKPARSTSRATARPPDAREPAPPGRSERKREDILAAAHHMFASRGFDATGLRELALEARVSTATIYAHFRDKHDLVAALLENRVEAMLREIVTVASAMTDPLDRLLASIRTMSACLTRDAFLAQLLAHRAHVTDRRALQRARAVEDKVDALCTAALTDLVARKILACSDVEALTVLVRVSMQGWLLTEGQHAHAVSEQRVTGMLVELISRARIR